MMPPPELVNDIDKDRWWLAQAEKNSAKARKRMFVTLSLFFVGLAVLFFFSKNLPSNRNLTRQKLLLVGSGAGLLTVLGEVARVRGASRHLSTCREALSDSLENAGLPKNELFDERS